MKDINSNSTNLTELLAHSYELNITADKLVVRTEHVLKGLGMKVADADQYLLDLIGELIIMSKELVVPRAAYVLYEQVQFNLEENKVIVSGINFNSGKIVTSFLKKSSAVILFSCTCGPNLETLSKEFITKKNGLEGFIIDLIGSELAESISGYLHDYIEEKLSVIGYGVTNRYSPGYCNWPVSDQHLLFSLLKGNNCGITLTPSSLMLPVKSVTGMLGIGLAVKRAAYKCNICKDEKCILRESE